jgi:hypothetical protein
MNFGLQGAPFNSNENENEIENKKQQRKNKTLRRPPINNGRLSENNGLPVNAASDRRYNKNVENMIGSIHSQMTPDDDEDNSMGTFYPPPHAELQNRKMNESNINQANLDELKAVSSLKYHVTPLSEGNNDDGPVVTVNVGDRAVTKEGFDSLPVGGINGYASANIYANANGTDNTYGYGSANANGTLNANAYANGNTYTGPSNYVGPYKQQIPYYTQMSQKGGSKDQLLEKLNYMILLLEEQKDEKTGHVVEELILYSFLGVFLIFIVDSFARAGKYTR